MKERPIIFSGPMVRAILGGRKTVTRRLVKPQPESPQDDGHAGLLGDCRYGHPGDALWVREGWGIDADSDGPVLVYKAGGAPRRDIPFAEADKLALGGWQSPIHMPRWASRITLEVVGVRVERLQDITEEDARAEGVDADIVDSGGVTPWGECINVPDWIGPFVYLWNHINPENRWNANPWVWRIEFKRRLP